MWSKGVMARRSFSPLASGGTVLVTFHGSFSAFGLPRADKRFMANIKSQKKRNRQNEVRRQRNKAVRSELKTRVKRAVDGAETGTEDAAERLRLAQKRLDKAGEKGIIHRNQAARRVSRLMKRAGQEQSA
jgi:small subunit ribosomal protein S20